MAKNWYEDFFSGVVVDLWQQAVPDEMTQGEADFLQRALKLSEGNRVLDCPCGYGRHAVELTRRGCQVVGVDVSAEMLESAAGLARDANVNVEFHQADMRDLNVAGPFDAAYCFGNSFGYLELAGTQQFLKFVSNALKPGGRFAFDYGMSAEGILPRFTEREWCPVDELLFLEENRYNFDDGCIETTYTFVRDGQVQTKVGRHWVFTVREIREMLATANFDIVTTSSSLGEEPFELGSPVLIVVAERQ